MGAYQQLPYEAITEAEFLSMTAAQRPLRLAGVHTTHDNVAPDRFCDNDTCETPMAVIVVDDEKAT